MKSEKDVLRKLANEIANRIIRKTISALQQVTDTLSGDDSELINAWDEICVQVQHEHSFYWDVYDEIARSFIRAYVEELKDYEELTLWFQTDQGWDWLYSDEERDERPPIFVEDIVQFVAQELYGKADNWSNERIRKYLDRQYLD